MLALNKERRFIFLSVFGLSLFGLLVVYSASCIYALKIHQDQSYFFKRQASFLLISLVVFFFTLTVNIDILRKYNKEFLLFTVFLLILVLIVGRRAGGAKRWLTIANFNFQPSELLKISFILYASDYFVRKADRLRYFKEGLLPLILVAGFIFSLIILEPDLGTVIFWLIWIFLMFFIVKVRKRHLILLILAGICLSFILIKTHPYRFMRLVAYFNPWADPRGSGFQLIQSQIAIGEGGFFGLGLGAGKQKLLFLPAAHTDFIFSIIAEEFGFLGSLSILTVYFLIFVRMMKASLLISNRFYRYICLSISFIFSLEVIINIGVSCGLFPTKGMTLPFISYGGTSLLIHYVLLGIFFNVTRRYEMLPSAEI